MRFGSLPDQQRSLYGLGYRQVLPDQQRSRAASALCEPPEMLRHGLEIMGDQNPPLAESEGSKAGVTNAALSVGMSADAARTSACATMDTGFAVRRKTECTLRAELASPI